MPDLAPLQETINYTFQDVGLLELALTHPSSDRNQSGVRLNNQRLEFLGDAVLQLVLTTELYHRFPEEDEGMLTKTRAALVNQETLATLARQIGLGPLLSMSAGEAGNGGRDRPTSLCDAFESLLGAIHEDGGFEAARPVILNLFKETLSQVVLAEPTHLNPKGELQEILQSRTNQPPTYEVISSDGPDHDREFVCAVFHDGTELGRGEGKSKKSAESSAASAALDVLLAEKKSAAKAQG